MLPASEGRLPGRATTAAGSHEREQVGDEHEELGGILDSSVAPASRNAPEEPVHILDEEPVHVPRSVVEAVVQPPVHRDHEGGTLPSQSLTRFELARACCGALRGVWNEYPAQFKALVAIVIGVSLSWVSNYLLFVLPAIQASDSQLCGPEEKGKTLPAYSARMMFVYFFFFASVRASLFVPCITSKVVAAQLWSNGIRKALFMRILRDVPMYVFLIGTWFFCLQVMLSPLCRDRSSGLYQTFRLYALYSCMVSVLWLLLVCWHNSLLAEVVRARERRALVRAEQQQQQVQRGKIDLQTWSYDELLFGDEEGKRYPSACPICLGTWAESDVIKVTHCQHAFHEECLGFWLQKAHTCALCRQDLMAAPPWWPNGSAAADSQALEDGTALGPLAPPASSVVRLMLGAAQTTGGDDQLSEEGLGPNQLEGDHMRATARGILSI